MIREIPNPDDAPRSDWDAGWRWWVAVAAAGICVVLGSTLLAIAYGVWRSL